MIMRWILIVAVACGLAIPSHAAGPRDELLRLVPEETAICLVVQGLRDRSKFVAESPLAAWIAANSKSTIGSAAELQKLKEVETLFTTFLGVSLSELRDDIFGDAIVLTYQPGPPGQPDAERGCAMLMARDPAKLAKLIEKLNSVQKTTGELAAIDAKAHRGITYHKRRKSNDSGEYYLLQDGLFVFAAQESSIQAVIDRRVDAKADHSLVAKSAARLGVTDAFLYCWFNPRRLDAEVKAHVDSAENDKERAMRRQFAGIWAALDDLAIYVEADRELEFGFAASYRADAMPSELQKVLGQHPRPSGLWRAIPNDAIVALAGRVTGNELLDVLLSFSPKEERAAARLELEKTLGAVVGKDKLPALLSGVGPDWAVWCEQPAGPGWFPGLTAAIRLDESNPEVVGSVQKAIGFYGQFLQVQYNREHDDAIDSKIERSGGVEATVFSNPKLFPPGFRPSYGIAQGHLVLAGSPERVTGFRRPENGPALDRAPFLRVSGPALREYIAKQGDGLSTWWADRQERPVADVKKEIVTLGEILQAIDRAEFFAQGRGEAMKLAVRVRFVQPLAK